METICSVGYKISVCLLTYNHIHLIESTLKSIQNQTVSDHEIIISDDCSTDGTWDLLIKLAEKDTRLRPIKTPKNLGMAGNANYAVSKTNRPYIALLHHDDFYREDLLDKWSHVLERHPNVSYVFNYYDIENAEKFHGKKFSAEVLNGKWFLKKYLLARWGCPVRGTAMIRRDFWLLINGMDEKFNLLADVDMWMKLSNISDVGYVSEPIIKPIQERPDNYPDIYTGKKWHWTRITLLYKIHETNILRVYNSNSLRDKIKYFYFQIKLNFQTFKWYTYAIVKRRKDMIETIDDSSTVHDFFFLSCYRKILIYLFR